MNQESHYRVMKALEANPKISQRELSSQLGFSLGKANYCLQALVEKGWIKAKNFKNSKNKMAYAYMLTPNDLDQKARITARFLETKIVEYNMLKQEIEDLTEETKRPESP